MTLYAATGNLGKLRELTAIFARYGWTVRRFDRYREPVEGDESYRHNALLKARSLSEQLRADDIAAPALGDDSGLEVEALGGRPGVLSARYGGEGATWADRRALLLEELAGVPDRRRSARFVCALALVEPDGTESVVDASVPGKIAFAARGELGFSYDPLFEDLALGRTYAELSEVEKDARSHRALAARKLVEGRLPAPSKAHLLGM